MKIFKFYLLSIVALLCSITTSAQVYEYQEGDFTYKIDLGKSKTEATLIKFKDSKYARVTIPDSIIYDGKKYYITAVGDSAFHSCRGLRSINFNKVKVVGSYAFEYCENLNEIDFGNVQRTKLCAFRECSSLKELDFKNMKYVAPYTFWNCSDIKKIDCGQLDSIDTQAFRNCDLIDTIYFNNTKFIGSKVFSGKVIRDIWLSRMTAPVLSSDAFLGEVFEEANVYIPVGSLQSYKDDTFGWSRFLNLQELKKDPNNVILSMISSKGGSLAYKDAVASGGQKSAEVAVGEEIELTFTPDDEWWVLESFYYENRDYTRYVENNKYTFTIEGNRKVEAIFRELPITLTVKHADNGSVELKTPRSRAYDTKINVAEGWKINTVTLNGTDVTGQLNDNNEFTTPVLLDNSIINVSYEYLNTAVTEVMQNDIRVSAYDGEIMVEGVASGTPLSVYTKDGALVTSMTASGADVRIAAEPGEVYVVKAGERTFKVAL